MGRINYAYRNYGLFFTTFTFTNEEVDEEFFQECMTLPQFPRGECEPMGRKATCEQCEHFGRRTEYVSPNTGKRSIRKENAIGDIAAEPELEEDED